MRNKKCANDYRDLKNVELKFANARQIRKYLFSIFLFRNCFLYP